MSGYQNPSDLGSRGCYGDQLGEYWLKGLSWLSDYDAWPEDTFTQASEETEAAAHQIKGVLSLAIQGEPSQFDKLLQKFKSEPLQTEETKKAEMSWIKKTQDEHVESRGFEMDQPRLNLQKDDDGIFICLGRLISNYPIYLPSQA